MSWICPYELNALGYSSFCDVFTLKEWKQFNYARDLASYYGSGYSPLKTWSLLESWKCIWEGIRTTMDRIPYRIVEKEYFQQRRIIFFFVLLWIEGSNSSSHDTDLVAIISVLGILKDHQRGKDMRWDKYDKHRTFRITSLVPMAGHLIVERLECKDTPSIRILINDRIQEIIDYKSLTTEKEYKGVYSISDFENSVKGKWSSITFCKECAPRNNSCINKISLYEPWQPIRYNKRI